MSLKDTLANDLTDAMRAGDEVRKNTLRAVIAEIKKAEIPLVAEHKIVETDTWASVAAKYGSDPGRLAASYGSAEHEPIPEVDEDYQPLKKLVVALPVKPIDDDIVRAIIAKHVKYRRDSMDAFQKAGRQDLVDKEADELRVLEAYMPPQMSQQEITDAARNAIAEAGATGPGDKGKVMSTLMPLLAGRADGRAINEIVTRLLNE